MIYALHGYSIGAEQWAQEIHVPQTIESAFANGAREMIVVLPDSKTVHNGSMYSASVTTGDFESFIARDVVTYIDAHYRTIPRRESRGLVGHSMGGYGASRIGMKHADVFGSLYIMSPCCMGAGAAARRIRRSRRHSRPCRRPRTRRNCPSDCARSSRRRQRGHQIRRSRRSISTCHLETSARTCSPAGQPTCRSRSSISTSTELRGYRAIAIDVGDQDGLKNDAGRLHDILDSYGIANTFEIYPGTHTSRVAFRIQEQVVPFFSRTLSFESAR